MTSTSLGNGSGTLTATSTPTYDARGNLTSAGNTTYAYNGENLLTSASGGTSASLGYDPLGRLFQSASATTNIRYLYDGLDMIAEYDSAGALIRRYVHGSGTDEPIVWYEGSGTTDRRFLAADERGSIVSVTDGSGAVLALNRYDEYGIPGSGNIGRFQYTGQAWLPEFGLQYSKARIYSPTLGRFLQADPIGTAGGINLYAYVGNDPIGGTDPSGLAQCTGTRIASGCGPGGIANGASGFSTAGVGGQYPTGEGILSRYFNLRGLSDEQIRDFGMGVLASLEFAQANGITSGTLATSFGSQSGYSGTFYASILQGASVFQAGLRGDTAVSNIPTDAQGYHFVGSGQVSNGILVTGQKFNLLAGDRILKVTTFSYGLAGGRNFATPLGSIIVLFPGYGSYFAPVLQNRYISTYYNLPSGVDHFFILPTVATPSGTSFTIGSKGPGR